MASNQVSRMDVQFSPFSLGFCPQNLNDLGTAMAANLTVSPGLGFNGINIGPVAPQNTDLPWFNTTVNDWFYWSTVTASWVEVRPGTITGEVPIGVILPWAGTIADVSAWFDFNGSEWLHADGTAISRTTYADLFAICGVQYGAGDGSTTFNIPDTKDIMLAGASVDSGGTAKTTIADPAGVALLKSRAYVPHSHAQDSGGAAARWLSAASDGNNYRPSQEVIVGAAKPYDPTEDIKIIPDFLSVPFVIRIK